jgi:very-short-patch-repair endonuclease
MDEQQPEVHDQALEADATNNDDQGRNDHSPGIDDVLQKSASRWIDQLIDLTGNNKLLYFKSTAGTVTLDPLRIPKLFEGGGVRLGDLTEPITFDAARSATGKAMTKAKENFEERGIDTLFMGIGMASWKAEDSKATPAAPVLLRPLQTVLENKMNPALHFDGEWVLNPTLVHYLNTRYKAAIGEADYTENYLDEEVINADSISEVFEILTAVVTTASPQSQFAISPSLLIGNFSYSKLPMVIDLQDALADGQVAQHELLCAMGGDVSAIKTIRERLPEVREAAPDEMVPDDEYLVLTADSSQSAVINSVLDGADLAVEGPPGTGKSQTIANLIATLSARGQRVLFVAEKRAAIDAVVRNLHEVGLDQLVMDLHGATNARSTVAKALSQSLANLQNALPYSDLTAEPLLKERERLASHNAAVVRVREPWGISFDSALQNMLETPAELRLTLRETVAVAAQSSVEALNAIAAEAEEFAEAEGLAVVERNHPWHDTFAYQKGGEAQDAQQLIDTAARLYDTFNAVMSRVERACDELGFTYPNTLDELQSRARMVDGVTTLLNQATEPIDEAEIAKLASALAPGAGNAFSRAFAYVGNTEYRNAVIRSAALLRTNNGKAAFTTMVNARDTFTARSAALLQPQPLAPYRGEPIALALQTLQDTMQEFTSQSTLTFAGDARLSDTQQRIVDLYNTRDVARRLPRLLEIWARIKQSGITTYVEAAAERKLSPADTRQMVNYGLYRSVCDAMQAIDPKLVDLPGAVHRESIARFAALDAAHISSTPQRVLRLVAEHAVDVRNQHEDEDLVIQKQARLQRRHMPVRQLLEKAPNVATALRPCWAMSPLIVAQVLPRAQLFDVVIFDEASQVTPADAIGSFLRAKRAVVAGDRRQLPPTSFWQSQDDSEGFDDEPDAESILDAIASIMPDLSGRRMLNWHYRSRDERLIAFSNAQPALYDWTLNTFSDARNEPCLFHHVVPQSEVGIYKDGSNPGEVQRVVTLVRKHIIENPDETLGVITMGAKHKNAILDALAEVATHDPLLRAFMQGGPPNDSGMEPFFVKNLETVQGDQRDAVIISIGYAARNKDDSLNHSFGPLNMDGGERRLNVAVTRAKNRVTLVTAFEPGEIKEDDEQKEGVKLLARYVKYAASGGTDLGAQHRPYPPLNPFELDIKRRLEEAGIPLTPQHGVSGYRIDFAAKDPADPTRFVLAIEADGASYHARPTVRDRDRLRQQQLERLGWRFCRIWSTDWFNDADAEVARVVEEWKQAIADKDAIAPLPEKPAFIEIPESERPLRGIRPDVRKEASLSAYSDRELYALADWIQSDNIARTTDEVIDEMFEELGFQRRTASARDKLHRILAGE